MISSLLHVQFMFKIGYRNLENDQNLEISEKLRALSFSEISKFWSFSYVWIIVTSNGWKSNIYPFIKDMVFHKVTSGKATFWSKGKFQVVHRFFWIFIFSRSISFLLIKTKLQSYVFRSIFSYYLVWGKKQSNCNNSITMVLIGEYTFSIFLAHWL